MKYRFIFLILLFCYLFSFDLSQGESIYKNPSTDLSQGESIYKNPSTKNTILHTSIDSKEYIVGPGDTFLFNMIIPNRILNLELIISPTSSILIPSIGSIDVKGKNLEDTYNEIIFTCKQIHEDAYVYVNINNLRQFKVLITGTSEYAGMHINSSNNRVSDLIESIYSFTYLDTILSQHLFDYPKNIMISKDITLIRNGSLISVNLFDYYINGDNSKNPILIEEDIINIKNTNNITVLGLADNPAIYLYEENKSVHDYILNTGTYSKLSKTIYVLDVSSGSKIKVNKRFIPKSGSIIFIDEKIDYKWKMKWDKIKDIITITSSLTSILLVLSNLSR